MQLTVLPDGVETVTKSSPTVHAGDSGRAKRPRLSLALTAWAILSRSIRTSVSKLVEHEAQGVRRRYVGSGEGTNYQGWRWMLKPVYQNTCTSK